jgi:hypothetical protein
MPEVIKLRETSCLNIAESLRRLAAEFERGEHGDVQFVAVAMARPHADFVVQAYGRCSPLEAAGLLARSALLINLG